MYLRRLNLLLERNIAYFAPHYKSYSKGHPEFRKPRNPFFDPGYEESIWGSRPRCILGGKHQVTMAPGIGIGPELMDIVKRVFLCANAPIDFEVVNFGENAKLKDLDDLIYSVERNGVAIKGNFADTPKAGELMPKSFQLKRALDLSINLVEMRSYHALVDKTRLKNYVDVVIICPNYEGSLSLLEHDNGKGVLNMRVTTQYISRKVAEFAFDYAAAHNRRKVTLLYNKGIMNWAEGTIVAAVSDVAVRYPQIPFHKQSMKAFIFKMRHFTFNGDVIVTMPLSAGLIKNILFGMMHGAGLYSAQNLGPRYAVFETAARNKGNKIMGKDLANPVGMLDAGVRMLRYLGHHGSADTIQRAVELTVNKDLVHTRDMLGDAPTSAVVANIKRRIREVMPDGYREETPPAGE